MMAEDRNIRISGYLDGELSASEREAFEHEVQRNPDLARELAEIRSMKEVTDSMKLKEFPDQIWEHYWQGTYNRLERRVGWLLLSVGAMVLMAAGLYELILSLIKDAGEPWWIRLAVGTVCGGLAILFISVVRERLFMLKRDPYREVKR
ncbi:anti-sigma factor family protein [Candidatus Eisenbacteria bacterium]|uniref:Anti-sigma factor family protein n=1 Tax=Eiseniibacteriota bacterium TaxID=2212470 RepID=A0ABV6YJA6_UNCEI